MPIPIVPVLSINPIFLQVSFFTGLYFITFKPPNFHIFLHFSHTFLKFGRKTSSFSSNFKFSNIFCYPTAKSKEGTMELLTKHLKENYDLSSYQVAQIIFLFKTILSELSKIIIIGFLLRDNLGLYFFALLIMLCLRSTTGGLHFYTYAQCLLGSFLFLWSAVVPLASITLPKYVKLLLLLACIISCYLCGPIVSKYRPEYADEYSRISKKIVTLFIFFYALLLYIMPENSLINTGFWIIILHSLQLIAAKIQKKGEALK